ncbi:hypothetical protein IGI37_003189 [Enterococcus sp. AZ194]|uniref:hypothetical protein n=1 Tax=Enterococcus sp. AZ194 TaxID=2774629 RepID=UPI003F254AB5
MSTLKIKKGIIVLFLTLFFCIESMICAGIIILGQSNEYTFFKILIGVMAFLCIFNLFLYLFMGTFVKSVTTTDDALEIITCRGKLYSYKLSECTIKSERVITGRGENKSTNYYLIVSTKNKTKYFKLGLFTPKQREEINKI